MEEFSLYQITNAFPQLMANEEISEKDKAKKSKYNWLFKEFGTYYRSNET